MKSKVQIKNKNISKNLQQQLLQTTWTSFYQPKKSENWSNYLIINTQEGTSIAFIKLTYKVHEYLKQNYQSFNFLSYIFSIWIFLKFSFIKKQFWLFIFSYFFKYIIKVKDKINSCYKKSLQLTALSLSLSLSTTFTFTEIKPFAGAI